MWTSMIRRTGHPAAVAVVVAVLFAAGAHAGIDAARKALSNNDYKKAVSELDQVLDDKPKDRQARFLKGLALARSGDTDGALDVFNALVEDQPDMAEAWNNLGVLRARKGNLKAARDALQKATRINPEHGPAQENLGDVYVALARDAYARAGNLEADNAIARAKAQQVAGFIGGQGSGEAGQSDNGNASANNGGSGKNNERGKQAVNETDASGQPGKEPKKAATGQRGGNDKKIDASTPEATVKSWAAAWSNQNVERYLAMYGDDFEPGGAISRAAWAKQRRTRVSSPSRIDVEISDLNIDRRKNQALATFKQRYRSNTYQDKERKALLLEKTDNGWRILREDEAGKVDFTTGAKSSAAAERAGGSDDAGGLSTSAQGEDMALAASDTRPATGAAKAAEVPAAGQRSAPAEMQAASDRQARRQAVRNALQDWAGAWSAQNVQAYLNAYSDNYHPKDGQSRVAWVRKRRAAVTQPAWIKVELSDMRVDLLNAQRSKASFNQHYQSDRFEDRERKRVTLLREDGGWRIVRES